MSTDKIKLVLRVEGLKQLAEEMAVGGYFSERHEALEEELPEMEQRVLENGGIELTMPLKLKSIGGHRNVIVPEGSGMTLKQDAVIRAIVARLLQYAQMIPFKCRSYRLTRK